MLEKSAFQLVYTVEYKERKEKFICHHMRYCGKMLDLLYNFFSELFCTVENTVWCPSSYLDYFKQQKESFIWYKTDKLWVKAQQTKFCLLWRGQYGKILYFCGKGTVTSLVHSGYLQYLFAVQ